MRSQGTDTRAEAFSDHARCRTVAWGAAGEGLNTRLMMHNNFVEPCTGTAIVIRAKALTVG